jgi:uncharacterized protein YkwD
VPPPAARLLLVLLACVLIGTAVPSFAEGMSRPERTLLRKMNNARANHGLSRLHVGSVMQTSAHRWARYLRLHDSFYHGRVGTRTSENIGWLTCRRGWAGKLVHMWLNSPAHRANLLDRSARRVGVGVSTGRWSGWSCVRMAVTRFR